MASKRKDIIIQGHVKSGLGEGRYYMSQKEYKKQFIEKLGIDPFLGTLNLQLSEHYAEELEKLEDKCILIKGFERDGKQFGDVCCHLAEVSGIKCALIQPKLSTHINTAELISEKHLRSALNLEDGSRVKVLLK